MIDGLDIRGTIRINANNVTIRRSRITGSDFSIINIADGVSGVRIEDVEIDGLGRSGTSNSMGVIGRADVVRSNIHGVENGITPASGSTIRDNYIHHLGAPGDPHYDGIQIDGGVSNVTIDHNTVDLSEHGQTSAVMIDDYFGSIANVAVRNNLLKGGGYTVYSADVFGSGTITGVSFTDNRMKSGYWGYASIENNSPVWRGNVDADSGRAISQNE